MDEKDRMLSEATMKTHEGLADHGTKVPFNTNTIAQVTLIDVSFNLYDCITAESNNTNNCNK